MVLGDRALRVRLHPSTLHPYQSIATHAIWSPISPTAELGSTVTVMAVAVVAVVLAASEVRSATERVVLRSTAADCHAARWRGMVCV